jgi:O-antigen ligase
MLLAVSLVAFIGSPVISPAGSDINRLITGTLGRLASLTSTESFEDPNSSLRWRDFEYQFALPQIVSHPFIGVGAGAMYRPFVVGRDSELFDGRRYIHNGHLSIIVKSGLLGYLCFLVFSLIALFRGFKNWRRITSPQLRAVVLGFSFAYSGILIGSTVSPMILTGSWTPVIGIMLGINEVIIAKAVRKEIGAFVA